jgi:hypothetical protein
MFVRALISAVQDAAGSYLRRILFYAVAGLAGLVSLGFLSASLYMYLRYWYGGFVASLWLAAIYGGIALIAMAVAANTASRRLRRRAEAIVAEEAEERTAQIRVAVHSAERALRASGRSALRKITPGGLIAAGLAAGFAASRWLRRR